MGWAGAYRPKGQSMRDFFQEEWGSSNQIIESALVDFTEFYAAVRKEDGTVFGVVVLVRMTRDYDWNFHYKDMDESMGPGYVRAPRRVLEALTDPATNEWAQSWREDCWKYIEYKESLPKLSKGDLVKFDKPVKFRNGDELDTFEFIKGSTFKTPPTSWYQSRYKLSGFREPYFGRFVKLEGKEAA